MFSRIFFLSTCFFASQVLAAPFTPKTIDSEIEDLITHTMPRADIGIAVIDATSGKTLYERNSHNPFTPASNTKVFTASAALMILGPDYQYTTSIQANKSALKNTTLNDDLYIKFSGDPSLTLDHLRELIKELKQKTSQVNGNIVIDNTQFSGSVYASGWSQEDLNWYFNAPVGAVILQENCIDVNIIPNSQLGNKAKLQIVDNTLARYFPISYDVKTVTYQNSMKHCSLNPVLSEQNEINVTGCWPISNQARTLHFAVKNPDLFAMQFIEAELKEQYLKYSGKIVFGKAPKNLATLAAHNSRPLKSLLRVMLKDSNNIYAESFAKTMGQKIYGSGSFQEGANVITDILQEKANIDPNEIVLMDGSGASRYNLFTPRQLARILFVMKHTPTLNFIFQSSLPESGQDGTLRNRMKSFDLKNKVFAKTGSMGGVSSLSGYLTTRDNHQVIFAIMMDHIVGKLDDARLLQAQIASIIYSGEPWSQ